MDTVFSNRSCPLCSPDLASVRPPDLVLVWGAPRCLQPPRLPSSHSPTHTHTPSSSPYSVFCSLGSWEVGFPSVHHHHCSALSLSLAFELKRRKCGIWFSDPTVTSCPQGSGCLPWSGAARLSRKQSPRGTDKSQQGCGVKGKHRSWCVQSQGARAGKGVPAVGGGSETSQGERLAQDGHSIPFFLKIAPWTHNLFFTSDGSFFCCFLFQKNAEKHGRQRRLLANSKGQARSRGRGNCTTLWPCARELPPHTGSTHTHQYRREPSVLAGARG